jgi:hypothetical protein
MNMARDCCQILDRRRASLQPLSGLKWFGILEPGVSLRSTTRLIAGTRAGSTESAFDAEAPMRIQDLLTSLTRIIHSLL